MGHNRVMLLYSTSRLLYSRHVIFKNLRPGPLGLNNPKIKIICAFFAMKTKNGNRPPAYQRIRNVIWERIDIGELKPGDAVDSERELAKLHQVSLMTARHALAELEHEGLVERRRGSGTFVAQPRIHFNKLTGFTEQMASRNLSPRSLVLSSSVIDSEHDIAARIEPYNVDAVVARPTHISGKLQHRVDGQRPLPPITPELEANVILACECVFASNLATILHNPRAVLSQRTGNQVAMLIDVDLTVERQLDLIRIRSRRKHEIVLHITTGAVIHDVDARVNVRIAHRAVMGNSAEPSLLPRSNKVVRICAQRLDARTL